MAGGRPVQRREKDRAKRGRERETETESTRSHACDGWELGYVCLSNRGKERERESLRARDHNNSGNSHTGGITSSVRINSNTNRSNTSITIDSNNHDKYKTEREAGREGQGGRARKRIRGRRAT